MKHLLTTRRQYLGAVTLCLSGSQLAGCLGSSSSNNIGPVYESASDGTVSDGDGGSNALFDGGTLELMNATLSKQDGVIAIRGELKNIENFSMANVRIEAQFLDENDAVLQQSLATVQSLSAGQVWNFEVPYPGSRHGEVAAATITSIVHY